ncbi:glycosyl hydrolase family 28-related protein [Salimicrobium sp. PL1-032A]|uniref:glycosyl hydrolase family 28-related protein n=1 Tax=Salimicrobium sp. PL1-032A TaxID=3095364 RepID=UPI003261CA92
MKIVIIVLAILLMNGLVIYMINSDKASTAPITVEAYGAESGDDTDDREAIQAAIEAGAENGSGVVSLTGDYVLESSITIREGVELAFGPKSRVRVRGDFPVIGMEKGPVSKERSFSWRTRTFRRRS